MAEIWNDAGALMRELSLENINIVTDKPPILPSNEDEHIREFFGEDYSCEKDNNVDPADFLQISQMLNIVKQHDDITSSRGSDTPKNESSSDTYVVSKLNPDVPEFVPNSLEDPKKPTSHANSSNASLSSTKVKDVRSESKNSQSIKNELEDPLPKVDLNNITTSEAVVLKEQFKSVINDTSEMTIRKKKRRNVAISNILKLNVIISQSKLPVQNEPSVDNVLKLMTPQDFMTSNNNSKSPVIEIDVPNSGSTASLETKVKETGKIEPPPKELQDSIEKVENWLRFDSSSGSSYMGSEPEIKISSPRRVFSPINVAVKPEQHEKVQQPTPLEVKDKIKKFVPKNKELQMKYTIQAQAKIERNETIWEKAEREMKEREKILQNRAKQTE